MSLMISELAYCYIMYIGRGCEKTAQEEAYLLSTRSFGVPCASVYKDLGSKQNNDPQPLQPLNPDS